MIIEGDGITLESFPRFKNQELADCLLKYITTIGDIRAFHRAHLGYFSTRSLLESCANNVFFLKALFNFKVDEFIVKESGILFFSRTLQGTLLRSLEHKNKASMSFLIAKGAFLTEKCLHEAISSNDVDLTEFVLSRNIWIRSEIRRCTKLDTPDNIRGVLERGTSMCKVQEIRNLYRNQNSYQASTKLSHMSAKDMSTAVEAMDFNTLQTIFQSPGLKNQHNCLIKAILDKKHKQLNDAIAIKRIAGQIDGTVVQYALHHCDLDMFRFLLLSSNISASHLNSVLSEAIHLNKTDEIEVLIKAGGQPTLEDFVNKAGTTCMGVECVVETIMKTTSWTREQLDRALDAAVRSGTHASMKFLIKGGAKFLEDALVNVSKRHYGPEVEYKYKLTASSTKADDKLRELLEEVPAIKIVAQVHATVQYVFSEHEWSQKQLDDALDAALVSGSRATLQLLRLSGGTFHSNALLAAVRNLRYALPIVRFVREYGEWSVDQLSNALHEALVICRPDFIIYLNEEGALFNDSSLKNVLRWKVEQHVQIKHIKHILKARTWSPFLLDEAIDFACETEGLAILASLPIAEARSESLTRNVLLKLRAVGKKKKWIIQTLKSRGMDADLALVLNYEIQEGCTDIVEHLIGELGISCDNDGLSNAMDNTRNYQSYERLKMVRLVRESQNWSDELLTRALDKAVGLGYSEVILYLHTQGAKFSDNSLEYAMMHKNIGYEPYDFVTYIMESRHFNKEQMNSALTKSLEIGHYKLVTMFHEKGAEFAEKSLQNAIRKEWILSDRLPAVQFILNARRWDTDEKNDALHKAVKLGDVSLIACLLKCGGEVSKQCLSEILEKKCKPSHRLCIVRLLLSSSHFLARELIEEAGVKARQLSEPKLEAYIQQCIK
ncbi:uncharacterized protein LOC110465863 [Mizuhopecten yessoensis]|uniref:uncharacterized protein LOC110465863 n=1 Tax=Mizuhopecten yessoensis TaxID=6573 RepID=UPI000B45DFA8|nr:uncharacterized protein LOC110465863 [Mizuhopecten yessoensis]XP_021377659.1 uncharacterized protein LOC110465863 [Mizuhopecten yessoensis]